MTTNHLSIVFVLLVAVGCGNSEQTEPAEPAQQAPTSESEANQENNTDVDANGPETESNAPAENESGESSPDETETETSDNHSYDRPNLNQLELTGTIPTQALQPPEFQATNRDNSERDKTNLIGKPTVMWFFPVANTDN